MITKQQFKKYLEDFQAQQELDDKISPLLEELCGTYVFFNCENKVYSNFIKVLEQAMGDEGETISWWLFEKVDHVVYEQDKGIKYELKTMDDLYLYLTKKLKPKKLTKKEIKELKETVYTKF